MANQLKMAEVQAILALARSGWSNRQIARQVGIHRETVGRHLRLTAQSNSKPASAPTGSSGAPIGQVSAAGPWRDVIVQKLETGLTAQRIYQDLCSDHGYAGSYYSVRRLIKRLMGVMPAPFRRMECEPGAEAQVDFGRGAAIVTPDGKRKATWVFRIVLSHSRKGYAEAVHRQTTDDFLRCLENAFAHFGGAPKTLVIDNLRAAVSRADWFDPELCPKVRSFAEHYGIAILPTRPYTPRHKGKIERGIGYVKSNALKGRQFTSLADQNRHLLNWESSVADTRIHGTTRRQVREVFEQAEKPALLPMPTSRFDLFQEAQRSVHRDGHVEVRGAYYSVPPEFLGQRAWARWDGRTVRLLDQKMRPIALHVQRPPGTFSTLPVHIVPEKIGGIERGTTWMLRRIEYIGPHATQWARSMLQSRGIEGCRVLMGLLSLVNTHSRQSIEHACQAAQSHGAYHLRSLRQLIEQQSLGSGAGVQQSFEFIEQHPIIRDLGDYGQFVRHQAIKAGFLVLYRSIFDLARDFLGDEDLGHQDKTLNRYLKPDVLIIDDMGMKQLPRRSGEYLLEIIMRRHENRSTIMTSNRPLEDWAKLVGDAPAATAILDRFLQHATIINITGKSYRLRHGGNADAKSDSSRGRRSTAGGEGLSPPEDTVAESTVSSVVTKPAAAAGASPDQAS